MRTRQQHNSDTKVGQGRVIGETAPGIIWLTGLSGAGKTTCSRIVQASLVMRGVPCDVLDGDVVRRQFSKDFGFSREDREENIRRIGIAAASLARQDSG